MAPYYQWLQVKQCKVRNQATQSTESNTQYLSAGLHGTCMVRSVHRQMFTALHSLYKGNKCMPHLHLHHLLLTDCFGPASGQINCGLRQTEQKCCKTGAKVLLVVPPFDVDHPSSSQAVPGANLLCKAVCLLSIRSDGRGMLQRHLLRFSGLRRPPAPCRCAGGRLDQLLYSDVLVLLVHTP